MKNSFKMLSKRLDLSWTLVLVLIGVSSALFSVGSRSDEVKSKTEQQFKSEKSNSAQWKMKMQDLYRLMVDLVADSSSEQSFSRPERKKSIEQNVKKLSKLTHQIGAPGKTPDADPSIQMIAQAFSADASRAATELSLGHRNYARSLIRGMTSYCIACHTRNASGPSFESLPMTPNAASAKGLGAVELAQFYSATRQYDRAFSEIQKVITDPQLAQTRSIEWERAIRTGLAITVRVKRDPEAAMDVANRVLSSQKSPYFLKQDATAWKESIDKWKSEGKRDFSSEEGLYADAVRLSSLGHEAQKFPADRSGDVFYLRATAGLHEYLQKYPQGRHAPEALLLLGMSYEILKDLNIEDFHESFYVACIAQAPHTPVALACYRRYEQSVYFNYTGSGGTYLPAALRERLQVLERSAQGTLGAQPNSLSDPSQKLK